MRTTYSRLLFAFILVSGFQLMLASNSSAQFKWPDKSENLQVLPETTDAQQLSRIMRGWTNALGVRCSYCHVGQGPLTEFDFVADDKEAKEKARAMVRMTRTINMEHIRKLSELESSSQDRVEVSCMTCHRQVTKPMRLDQLLAQTFETDGIDEVFTHYDELREAYYGGSAYDFREGILTRLAEQLSRQGNQEEALKVLEKEIELHDEFADVYGVQGQIWEKLENTENAIASYEKGKSLSSPRGSRWFQEQIDKLKSP